MHTLGFLHEHQRPDRDEFVEILWDNIAEEKRSQYTKLTDGGESTYGTTYNLYSVMHYNTGVRAGVGSFF